MLRAAILRHWFFAAAISGCVFVASCAHRPVANAVAPGETAIIEANRRAEANLRSGNLDGAVRYYREAARLAQTIEDTDGIAANAVNLSIVYQRLGKYDEARASLAPVLDQGNLSFPPARLAQAALRRSVLDLDERRFAGAAGWIEQAAVYCGRQGCPANGAIHNVKGQLALESGRLDAAAAEAKTALEASRSAGNRAEIANALRLLGIVSIRSGDAAAALVSLGEALEIDRDLALPRKIYLDLVGLGRASASRGEQGAARAFYERAVAVSEADRDAKGAAEARALVETTGR